jgi:PAS domain-containing protein
MSVSIVVAVVAATAALWIATRNTRSKQRLGAAVVMGLAIAGMHYSAMQGLTFAPDPSTALGPSGLHSTGLGAWVAGTTLLVLFLATCAATFDRRLAHVADREAAKLRESEERYRLLLRSITDYAIFMLDEFGNVTNWNPGAARIKGYAADEIVGSHFSRVPCPSVR